MNGAKLVRVQRDALENPPDDDGWIDAPIDDAGLTPRPKLAAIERNDDQRPTISVTTDLHVVVPSVIDALTSGPCWDDRIFQRDGALVRLVHIAEPETIHVRGREVTLAAVGTPQIRDLPISALAERLSAAAIFSVETKKGSAIVHVPARVVSAVHARGEWPGVRPIVGISEVPILRPDFSIATTPGYDAATGVVLAPSTEIAAIPERPTPDDARRAFGEIAEIFHDFPFRSAADRSVPIAALLTLLARHAIRGAVPCIVFDAPAAGSGKTLVASSVAMVATGRAGAVMTFPEDDAELEKVLASYALRAPAVILFDNLAKPLGGPALDKVITASDTVDLRVLGRSEVPTLRWRSVILVTGNQIEVRGDTTRRVLVCRIEPLTENPDERDTTTFLHPDLLRWVEENRPRLVAAGLTLLRAWHLAGRPQGECRSLPSFEAWASIVPPAVVFGGGDPMTACRLRTTDGDPSKSLLRALREHWIQLDPSNDGLHARELVSMLFPARNDGYDAIRDAVAVVIPCRSGELPTAMRMGKALGKLRGCVTGGMRFVGGTENGKAPWRWEPVG